MIDMQSQQPKVSILIPVFNRKDFIGECIQSALDQTFADFEVVVVDNASDDGTWDICQQFAARDRRVRIFRNQANVGPVRNWIRCAQEAKGDYSKILFSDDCLDRNCLSTMLAQFDEADIGFVYCAANVGPSKELSSIVYSVPGKTRLSRDEYFKRLLRNDAPASPGAILIRTSDLSKNLHYKLSTSTPRPFERHGAGPDIMISLLTMLEYTNVANIPKPLVFFRSHADSFSILNTNGEVTKGYRSAISLFLKTNYSPRSLMSYLAFIWLQEMLFIKHPINPKQILMEYEGTGSIYEILMITYSSIIHLKNKILGRKMSLQF